MKKKTKYGSKRLGVAYQLAKDLSSIGMLRKDSTWKIAKACLSRAISSSSEA